MAKQGTKYIAAIAAAFLLALGGAGAASAGDVHVQVTSKTLWCC
jgi:hypothetical protein